MKTAHFSLFPIRLYILPVTHGLAPDVLVVRFSAIGDILLITPLLRAIRTRHPGARIAVLTKEQYAPLLSHNPHVSEVLGVARDEGIRANVVLPGTVDTEANRRSMPDADHARWTSPVEIARVSRYLASPESRPINGASVPVYGFS